MDVDSRLKLIGNESGENDFSTNSIVDEKADSYNVSSWFKLIKTLFFYSLIGFFVNFQPSEPYLSVYLTTEKSISKEELNNKVYPWDTYGSLVALLLLVRW